MGALCSGNHPEREGKFIMCVCVGLSLTPLQHTYLPTKSNKTSTESSNSVVLVTASLLAAARPIRRETEPGDCACFPPMASFLVSVFLPGFGWDAEQWTKGDKMILCHCLR